MTPETYAVRGRLLLGQHLETGTVIVQDGRIEQIMRSELSNGNLPATVIDAGIVTPGMIDLQVNGAIGHEVGESAAAIESIARWMLESGVTAWLPTIVTSAASS